MQSKTAISGRIHMLRKNQTQNMVHSQSATHSKSAVNSTQPEHDTQPQHGTQPEHDTRPEHDTQPQHGTQPNSNYKCEFRGVLCLGCCAQQTGMHILVVEALLICFFLSEGQANTYRHTKYESSDRPTYSIIQLALPS